MIQNNSRFSITVLSLITVCLIVPGQSLPERVNKERLQKFPLFLPGEIESKEKWISRAAFQLGKETSVEILEYRVQDPDEAYNTTIVIRQRLKEQRYLVPGLISGGENLRLICALPIGDETDHGKLVLGLTAGWTDAVQGFVLITRLVETVKVYGFPMVDQGKIVFNRKGDRAELWSADRSEEKCSACPKHYEVQDCTLGQNGFVCKKRKKIYGPLYPNSVTAEIISVK